jgi:hypothetical protein
MSLVLVEAGSVTCANQGTVKLKAGQSKLTVGGSKALVDGDMASAPISGCTTVTDPNTSALQCLLVASASGGVAGKLTVGGKGVLLKDVSGNTNGTVGGTPQKWSVQDAGQTKLKAV